VTRSKGENNKITLPTSAVSSIIQDKFNLKISNLQFSVCNVVHRGEVTELVPVPDFKSAVPQRELRKVSSILMLSRQFFNEMMNKGRY
jgi:hypothetical protein